MCIMVDLPPAMVQEAREYATVQGTTLERMVFDCLKAELEKRHEADKIQAVRRRGLPPRVRALRGSLRLPRDLEGKSYKEMKDEYFADKYGELA